MSPSTLPALFFEAIARWNKPQHLRVKRDGAWTDVSSAEFRRAVEELALGLRGLGLGPGDALALVSENRPEWAYVDLATLCLGARDVPIYATLTPDQIRYILEDSGSKIAVVSSAAQAAKLAQVRAQLPRLEHVVAMADGVAETLSLSELRARGRAALAAEPEAARHAAAAVRPDDLATIIYTSGTTGDPKGVMLTHANLVSNVIASQTVFADWAPTDTCLSFLPLCHVFERMAGHYLMLHAGVTIAYAESVETVPQNLLEVQPTIMLSVPRLYEKVHRRILDKVAADPPLRRAVFFWALATGREWLGHHVAHTTPGALLRLRHAVAQRLVFGKVQERVGGRMRLFVSGGAPLAQEIAEFFGAVGLIILEGYGLTETSPVIAVNRPERMRPGSVGPALDGVEVKIAADGEILTRGPHVMTGYFNKPEATREVLDADGWFHTGDIGHLDRDGFLFITDRKKDLIVTSGGKNIAPQPIENRIKTDPFIAEFVMVGNRRQFPAALVVPAFEHLEAWARDNGVAATGREALIGSPEVQRLFEDRVATHTASLAKYERVKKLTLLPTEFSIEAGELTPTLKVKRRFVEKKYTDLIDKMYSS